MEVYIGTGSTYNKLIENFLNPGIFHTKSLTHGEGKYLFHKNLISKNFSITSLDQEHGVIDDGDFDDLFIKPRVNERDIEICDKYFCWGQYDKKKLSKKFNKKKFILTGSPRVDLWKKRFRNLWLDKLFKEDKFFLFVSNFSFCNNFYSFKEILKRKEKKVTTRDLLILKNMKLIIYISKKLYKFVNLLENLQQDSKKDNNMTTSN